MLDKCELTAYPWYVTSASRRWADTNKVTTNYHNRSSAISNERNANSEKNLRKSLNNDGNTANSGINADVSIYILHPILYEFINRYISRRVRYPCTIGYCVYIVAGNVIVVTYFQTIYVISLRYHSQHILFSKPKHLQLSMESEKQIFEITRLLKLSQINPKVGPSQPALARGSGYLNSWNLVYRTVLFCPLWIMLKNFIVDLVKVLLITTV